MVSQEAHLLRTPCPIYLLCACDQGPSLPLRLVLLLHAPDLFWRVFIIDRPGATLSRILYESATWAVRERFVTVQKHHHCRERVLVNLRSF